MARRALIAPSTHIVKPAVEHLEGVVFNEALCMRLAGEAGLPAARAETRNVDGLDYLLVERYDRVHRERAGAAPVLELLHQEDSVRRRGSSPSRSIKRKVDRR